MIFIVLFFLRQAIKQLPLICEAFENFSGAASESKTLLKEVFLLPIQELYKSFEKYLEMLDTTLDFDMVNFFYGLVA